MATIGVLVPLTGPHADAGVEVREAVQAAVAEIGTDRVATTWKVAVRVEDGTVQMDEGFRVMPYVATGSAGFGLVLGEFLAHRADAELAETLDGMDAFRHQSQHPLGIDEKRPSFLR